jgi:hypothetical protein
MRLTEAFTAGDVAPVAYQAKTADIRQKRASLEIDVRRAAVDPSEVSQKVSKTLALATSLWDLYERFNDERRAEFLHSMFSAVVLNHEGIVGHSLKAPLSSLIEAGLESGDADRSTRQAEALLDAALAA